MGGLRDRQQVRPGHFTSRFPKDNRRASSSAADGFAVSAFFVSSFLPKRLRLIAWLTECVSPVGWRSQTNKGTLM